MLRMRCLWTACVLLLAAVPSWGATLVVANKSDDTVDLVALDTGRSVATLPTGHAPHEVAVSADGRTAVVANYGDRERSGDSLTVVDLRARKVARTIDLGEHRRPHGLTFVARSMVAVTTEGSRHVLVVDIEKGVPVVAVPTEQSVSHMLAVTPDGKRAFIANIGSGSVTAVDLEAGKKLRDVKTGDGAEGIAITPDGREVWVGNRAADTVSVIDAASLEVVATLPCKGFPIRVAITPNGERALVSCARAGEVAMFDVPAREEIGRTKLDLSALPGSERRLFGDRFGQSPVPIGLVIAPDGKRAWVAATQSDVVVALDLESFSVAGLLRAGKEPDGMAYSPIEQAGTKDSQPGR